jgi:hypothetical protein
LAIQPQQGAGLPLRPLVASTPRHTSAAHPHGSCDASMYSTSKPWIPAPRATRASVLPPGDSGSDAGVWRQVRRRRLKAGDHCEVGGDGLPEATHVLLGRDDRGLLARAAQDAARLDPRLQLLVPCVLRARERSPQATQQRTDFPLDSGATTIRQGMGRRAPGPLVLMPTSSPLERGIYPLPSTPKNEALDSVRSKPLESARGGGATHLAYKVDDPDHELVVLLVGAHQQAVVHHAQRRQEGGVSPQRSLKPG